MHVQDPKIYLLEKSSKVARLKLTTSQILEIWNAQKNKLYICVCVCVCVCVWEREREREREE